jgi:hypothetical protein
MQAESRPSYRFEIPSPVLMESQPAAETIVPFLAARLRSTLKGGCILLLILARSYLAHKKQNGLETYGNVLKISCADPLAIGQAWWLLTLRRGRRFG